jgi:hypothetical protein
MKKRGLAALVTLDVAFLVFLAAVGVAFILDARRINAMAASLPTATSVLMIGLIVFVLYGKVRDAFRPDRPAAQPGSAEPTCEVVEGEPPQVSGRQLHWFVAWLMIASYPLLVMGLGFTIASLLFLTTVAILMGTKPATGLLFGLACTAVLAVLFIVLLKVPMPDSILGEIIPQLHGY